MQPDRASRTALATAYYRAHHHLHDEPKLFDDPLAQRLLTAGEMAVLRQRYAHGLVRTPAATVLARARYTEDRLATAVARGVRQYVLVGAGLDTFAYRRTDLRDRVQVFELDHPQSQALKRERLAAAGLIEPPNLHFGAVDFEHERIGDALARLPFRNDLPAVFAWLGVSMYLTRAAIDDTWRALRAVAASGSELVFDFIHAAALSDGAPAGIRNLIERTRAVGEPIISGFDPSTLGGELHAAGWTLLERLDPSEINRRFFASRTDGYRAGPSAHLACAGVD